jgi:formamidopyrimidine-DNA glycosylase
MPEAPDLEVIRDFLNQRAKGLLVEQTKVLHPLELRVLTPIDFVQNLAERSFLGSARRGYSNFDTASPTSTWPRGQPVPT